MEKVYVDTNIILDYLLPDRRGLSGRNLSLPASNFFMKVVKGDFKIVISSWTLNELYRKLPVEGCKMFFELLRNQTETVEHTDQEIKKAKQISPTHFQDALHCLLAKKAGATCIATRNVPDFEFADELGIEVKLPENF